MTKADDDFPPPNVTLIVLGGFAMAVFLILTPQRQAELIASLRLVIARQTTSPGRGGAPEPGSAGTRRWTFELANRLGMAWLSRFAEELERISGE